MNQDQTAISKELVVHFAQLANVPLSDTEITQFQSEISSILDHIETIQQLQLDNADETVRVSDEINILRDDIVEASLTQQESLQNAKQTSNGFFVVKRLI